MAPGGSGETLQPGPCIRRGGRGGPCPYRFPGQEPDTRVALDSTEWAPVAASEEGWIPHKKHIRDETLPFEFGLDSQYFPL